MSTVAIPDYGLAVSRQRSDRRAIRVWLYLVLVAMLALFVVGGATRLTDSGLSIVEWKPIHGVIPPLSEAEWQEELEKYRAIPEYQQFNKGMSLEGFKAIYWWEWTHRILARGVGVLFALPLVFFWLTGRIERGLGPRLFGLLVLGGLQGAVGWWMVASGLTERTDVSQYRLSVHLTLACVIFAATMWVARGLAPHSDRPATADTRRFAGIMVLLVLVQIYLGALVAGLDAGMAFNTWPLMDGAAVPQGLATLTPVWTNLFENPKTVQFVHRIGAYLVLLAALWHALAVARADPRTTHARRAAVLLAMIVGQAALGIATLVLVVPFGVALAHHAFAVVVLGFAVAHWRGTVGPYRPATGIAVRT